MDKSLPEEHIKIAKLIIEQDHPLSSLTCFEVFPTLRKLRNLPFFKSSAHFSNLEEESKKSEESEDDERGSFNSPNLKQNVQSSDPFHLFGFGINYYLYQMRVLIGCMTVICILMSFALYYFSNYDSGKQLSDESIFLKTTLGNLYGSFEACSRGMYSTNQVYLSCSSETSIGEIVSLGILESEGDDPSRCQYKNSKCESFVDVDNISLKLTKECSTKQLCSQNFESLISNTLEISENCPNLDERIVFIKYTCKESNQTKHQKDSHLFYICSIDLLSAFIFISCILYMNKKLPSKFEEWDLSITTAADYSVEYIINQQHYLQFSQKQQISSKQSKLIEYKEYLIQQFEAIIGASQTVFSHDVSHKIAEISFSFQNKHLIHLLSKRGDALINNKMKKLAKIEEKIDYEIKTHFDKYTIPHSAFITFEHEESYMRATSPAFKHCIDGIPIQLSNATEPTNIIWENRSITNRQRIGRRVISIVILAIILGFSMIIIFLCKKKSFETKKGINYHAACSNLNLDIDDESLMMESAFAEWINHNQIPNYRLSGVLQCFCQAYKKEHHLSHEEMEELKLISTTYKDENGNFMKASICQSISSNWLKSNLYDELITLVIVLINYILKYSVKKILNFNQYSNLSDLCTASFLWNFVLLFSNTAIIILLVNANLSSISSNLSEVFNGSYSDFTLLWYNEVGCIFISTIALISISPIFEGIFIFIYNKCLRYWDSRSCNNSFPKQTKTKSIQKYIDLYSGGRFRMDLRYSSLMNLLFVIFLYGGGMPVLFFLGLLGLIVNYLRDKIFLAYYYKKPPMYDHVLCFKSLELLPYAGILHLIFSYWMLSNHALRSEGFDEHWIEMNSSFPLFLMGIILLIGYFFRNSITKLIRKVLNITKPSSRLSIEKLLPYFESLSCEAVRWWIQEEQYARNILNIQILREQSLKKLQNQYNSQHNMVNSKTLINTHCYDILANPIYMHRFQYFPNVYRSASDLESAKVRIVLSLGYYPKERAQQFTMRNIHLEKFIKNQELGNAIYQFAQQNK